MKIGICCGVEFYEKAFEAGADFIEVNNVPLHDMSDEKFAELCEFADKHKGQFLAANGLFPGKMRLTGEEQSPDIREFLEKSIKRLARLGVKFIVFGSGAARNCPDGFPMEKAKEQVLEIACMAADLAAPYGINVGMEPLRAEETNMIHSAADSCEIAKLGNRPNLLGHVDFYHFMQGGETLAELEPCIPMIGHVHIASPVKRTIPVKGDCADYGAFLKALRDGGYDGTVSFEGKRPDDWGKVAESLNYIRSL